MSTQSCIPAKNCLKHKLNTLSSAQGQLKMSIYLKLPICEIPPPGVKSRNWMLIDDPTKRQGLLKCRRMFFFKFYF